MSQSLKTNKNKLYHSIFSRKSTTKGYARTSLIECMDITQIHVLNIVKGKKNEESKRNVVNDHRRIVMINGV